MLPVRGTPRLRGRGAIWGRHRRALLTSLPLVQAPEPSTACDQEWVTSAPGQGRWGGCRSETRPPTRPCTGPFAPSANPPCGLPALGGGGALPALAPLPRGRRPCRAPWCCPLCARSVRARPAVTHLPQGPRAEPAAASTPRDSATGPLRRGGWERSVCALTPEPARLHRVAWAVLPQTPQVPHPGSRAPVPVSAPY